MGNKIKIFDFTLFIVPLIITALSIALIYSLVFSGDDVNLALRQGIFAAGSIAIAVKIHFLITGLLEVCGGYSIFSLSYFCSMSIFSVTSRAERCAG